MNRFGVGAVGRRVAVNNLGQGQQIQPKEALELGAWLVATAIPLMPGKVGDHLAKFHRMLGDAADGGELEELAEKHADELEE